MKKIIIDSCENCPMKNVIIEGLSIVYECNYEGIEGTRIDNLKSISDWCPLEDN